MFEEYRTIVAHSSFFEIFFGTCKSGNTVQIRITILTEKMTDEDEHEHRVREQVIKFAESASDEQLERVWNELFLRMCALCGATKSTNPEKPKLQKCAGCFCSRYCCVDHQKQHRKKHRAQCKEIAAKHEDMKKTARLNEAWDVAVDFIRNDDIDGFKKVMDENDEELVNWGHDEHNGCTLLRALTELARESFMSILLERGADVNAKSDLGVTALMLASQKGDPSCISVLLDGGADVNANSNIGITALKLASQEGHSSCISLLLDGGAAVNAKNNDGVTALKLASRNGHSSCISLLLDGGADVNAKNNDGVTALMSSSRNGHSSCISLLLDGGADVNAKNNNGYTALMTAGHEGCSSCISLLLDGGADVNAKNNNGYTALMLASHKGHISCISLLLKRGSDVNAIANNGFTTASSLTKDRQIIRMLTRAKADKNNGRSGTNPVLDYDTVDW